MVAQVDRFTYLCLLTQKLSLRGLFVTQAVLLVVEEVDHASGGFDGFELSFELSFELVLDF